MDMCSRQRELFFHNLQILDFDKYSIEKEYRVKCDKDMFSLPNQKMFEVVTFFLFEKLSEVSEKEYSLPWPLLDKDMRRQFQKATLSYLSSIATESVMKFPRVVLSVISTFGGDRFYELYFAFSSHVVEKTIRRNDNVSLILKPSISKHNYEDAVETLKTLIITSSEKLQEVLNFSLKSFEFSLKTSNNFITHIQKLKSSLTTNSSLLEEKNVFLASLFFCETDVNGESLKCNIGKILENAEKVKKCWKQLQAFLGKEKNFWNCIYPAIQENSETFLLDGAQLEFDINDSIKEHCPELNQIGIMKSPEGKICLLKYLKLYSILLELYEKTLLKGDLGQIKELCNVQKTWTFGSTLNELKTLHEKLMTTVISIKENNKVLQDRLMFEDISEDLLIFAKECPSWDFCSKSFQNEISTTRQIFINKMSDDILKTSLFTNDSGLESGNWKVDGDTFCSSSSDLSSARQSASYNNSISFPSSHLPIVSCCSNSFSQTINQTSTLSALRKEDIKSEGTLISDTALRKEKLKSEDISKSDSVQAPGTNSEKNVLPQSSIQETGLFFDIDLEWHRTSKIRESWLLEESLDSVTLPEIPFLD